MRREILKEKIEEKRSHLKELIVDNNWSKVLLVSKELDKLIYEFYLKNNSA